MMGIAADIYTRLMFARGHGYPLWEPEPTESGEVLIGDVGYVLDGGFYRLFNATLPADHPFHEQCGVPDSYEPFQFPNKLLHRRLNALEAGAICSKSVSAINMEVSAEVGAALPSPVVSGRLRFKCSNEQGAMLVLKHNATCEALHPCKDLKRYIAHNHNHWYRFAQDVYRLDIPQHNILFVSGWVKTAEWALTAVTHRAREGEIVFGGGFGPLVKAAFSVGGAQDTSISVEHRCGPKRALAPAQCASGGAIELKPNMSSGDTHIMPKLKHDQCIFFHYYKLKRCRLLAPKVIRAASAEPSAKRSPSPNDKTDADVSLDADGETSFVDKTLDISFDSSEFELDSVPARRHPGQTDTSCVIACDEDMKLLGFYPRKRTICATYQNYWLSASQSLL
ncbi:hypothetical protein C8Q80DRAFT_1116859 [Daedaleopsis nitida]|nr:hypothetical protein C8Q80DRAFT_1116859 [Daedaleopsis nitida]